MKDLYPVCGISKQAHFKARRQALMREGIEQQVVSSAAALREAHPAMGCRKMYQVLGEQLAVGRDRFESILLNNGFRVRFPRNYVKTTRSFKGRGFDNLISGKRLDGIDQVWQSDIAYIKVADRYYYLVFVVDVYSRRILGYQVNHHMLATANIKALKQAIHQRGKQVFDGLIHHSDRGAQYIDKRYIQLQRDHHITTSMAKHCWENAYVERVNGIIKNEYLRPMELKTERALQAALKRVVWLYNNQRPHLSLPDKMTPVNFEKALEANYNKPTLTIYNSQQQAQLINS